MTLHAPSRTSSALRSGLPGRPATAAPSFQTSSRRICCPFGAPNPRNPLPGAASPPVPAAGSHRRSVPVVPPRLALRWSPYLVAGFQSRSGPPAPFLTTLTVSASSGPVECFIHSRPWGSAPGSPMPLSGRRVRRPHFPGLVRVMRTKVRVTRSSGGERSLRRLLVDSAVDSCRNSHPSVKSRSQPRRTGSGSSFPLRLQAISGS
jgi:hypothetical protein